jgi:hypothetical protein
MYVVVVVVGGHMGLKATFCHQGYTRLIRTFNESGTRAMKASEA